MFLCFDPEQCQLEVLEKFDGEIVYDWAEYDAEAQNFWFIPPNNQIPILKWNLQTHVKTEISNSLQISFRRVSFYSSICAGRYLWFLPGLADEALKIDLENDRIELAPEFKPGYEPLDSAQEQWKYTATEKHGDCLYAYDGSSGEFVEWDLTQKKVRRNYIKIEGTSDRAAFWECSKFLDKVVKNHMLPEKETLEKKEKSDNRRQVGKQIFQHLKERSFGI